MTSDVGEPLAIWQQFFSLGEDLLKQKDTASIKKYLCGIVAEKLLCEANLFLVEPSYPLPGEEPVSTIPSSPAPSIVQQALKKKNDQTKFAKETKDQKAPFELAVILKTQETFLAILHVKRTPQNPFSSHEIELLKGIASFAAVSMQTIRQITLKNWRYDQISLVRSVSEQIANLHDLDELCTRIASLIQTSFNYYFVSIFTTEKDSDLLHFRASSKRDEPKCSAVQLNIRIGNGMIGTTAKTGKELVAKDVTQDPYFKKSSNLPETKAEATIPLAIEGRILGVLDIQSDLNESFHENDMLVLRALANNIALAVEGTRLYQTLKKRAEQLNAVLEINYALSSILDLDTLLDEIVDLIHERFHYPFVHIFTINRGRRKIIYQAGSGSRAEHVSNHSFAFDLDSTQGLIPHVTRTGSPFLANDVSKEPLYLPSKLPPYDTRSELAIPLSFGKDVMGVLDIQSDKTNAFDNQDLEFLEGLASGIALALRNATLFRTEKWRRQVADSFQDVAGMLSSNTDLSILLDRVLVELEKNLPCDASAIWLLTEPESNPGKESLLRLAAVHGVSPEKITKVLEGSAEVQDFVNNSLNSTSPSIRQSGGPFGPLGLACKFPANYSSISVPLRAGEKVLGALTMAHHIEGRYGSEASAISSTFANYAAVAIQNARLFSTAQAEAWSSTVLLQVAEATQSISGEEELLTTMTRLTPLLVGIDQCGFYLHDSNQLTFTLKSWYGFHPQSEELTISESDSLAFLKIATTKQPVFIKDPSSELHLHSLKHTPENSTVVLIPLVSREDVLGTLLISHKAEVEAGVEKKFNDQTLAILQGITQQTTVALENIRLIESRQEEAYITAVLLQVAQAVVSQNNLNDIFDTIIHLMPILVGIDTCVIYLWDKNKQIFIPAQAPAEKHGLKEWLQEHSFHPGDYPLLAEVQRTQKFVTCQLNSPDVPPEEWIKSSYLLMNDGQYDLLENSKHWLFGFPLGVKGDFYGALVAIENDVPASFQSKRIELLNGVAQQISLAIQEDRLNQEIIDRERMEKEIQLARQIQKTFLPESLPQPKGWQVDLRWNTAREVGGDFYDVFFTQNNKIAIAIADVSDKGMPAALYMTVTRTLIRATAQSIQSPAKVLERVNELLASEDNQDGMFVTAVYAVLDPLTGELIYSNAGHNLPLLYRKEKQTIENLLKGGIALNVLNDAKYEEHVITLHPGDTLLMYTDGVTETFSPEGEPFAETGLLQAMNEACKSSDDQFLESIEKKIDAFRNGQALSDDVTMISVHRQ